MGLVTSFHCLDLMQREFTLIIPVLIKQNNMLTVLLEDFLKIEGEEKFDFITNLCSNKIGYNLFKWKSKKEIGQQLKTYKQWLHKQILN